MRASIDWLLASSGAIKSFSMLIGQAIVNKSMASFLSATEKTGSMPLGQTVPILTMTAQ